MYTPIPPFVFGIIAMLTTNQTARERVESNPLYYKAFIDMDMTRIRSVVYEMYTHGEPFPGEVCSTLAELLGFRVFELSFIEGIVVQLGGDPAIGSSGMGTIYDWAGVSPRPMRSWK